MYVVHMIFSRLSFASFRQRCGFIAIAATLLSLTIPGVGYAWTENPTTATVATSSSWGSVIASDSNGNVYQVISYDGTVTIGSFTVNASTPSTSAYAIVKFDSMGIAQWVANTEISSSNLDIQAITVDNSGNVLISGSFQGTVSIASTTLTSAGASDGFVAKISNSGAWIWAKRIGGTSNDWAPGVDTDSTGNIYISGGFQSSMTVGSTTLTSAGSNDLFIAKLDSSGNFQWVNKVGGIGDDNPGWLSNLAVDTSGNSYVSGQMSSSFTINGNTFTSTGGRDAFVAKFDSSGTFVWGANGGSTSSENVYGIALDTSNNVFITGNMGGNATFGSNSLTTNGSRDGFLAKLSNAGAWMWAVNIGSNGGEDSYSVGIDSSDNPFISGSFLSPITIGGSTLTSAGLSDGFIAKWNSTGTFQWAKSIGGTGSDELYGVTGNRNGNVYFSGYVTGPSNIVISGGSPITVAFSGGVSIFLGLSLIGGVATTTTSTTSTTTTTPTTSTTPATTIAPTSITQATIASSDVSSMSQKTGLPVTGSSHLGLWCSAGLFLMISGIALGRRHRRLFFKG